MEGADGRFDGKQQPNDKDGREFGIWLTYAIALAFGGTAVLAVFVWSWAWVDGAFDADRINILSRFAVYLVAAVTFCTVVWRGLISARQADYQQAQLDSLARQIASTEENNFAQLLQKGAELIEDNSKPARVDAGIAILQAVAEAPNDKFREQARGLIAYFIQRYGRSHHRDRGVNLAISAFNSIYKSTDAVSSISFDFEEDAEEASRFPDHETNWKIVYGANTIYYDGGDFTNTTFGRDLTTKIYFRGVGFIGCTFDEIDKLLPYRCYFNQCQFKTISTGTLSSNNFNECNFSGVQIINITDVIPSLKKGKNWYDPENPPVASDGTAFDWDEMLIRGKPPTEFPF